MGVTPDNFAGGSKGRGPRGYSAREIAAQLGLLPADSSDEQFIEWLRGLTAGEVEAFLQQVDQIFIAIGSLSEGQGSNLTRVAQLETQLSIANSAIAALQVAPAPSGFQRVTLPESAGWELGFAIRDAAGNYGFIAQQNDKGGTVTVLIDPDADFSASTLALSVYEDAPEIEPLPPLSPDWPAKYNIIILNGQSPAKFTIGTIGPKVNDVVVPDPAYYDIMDKDPSPRHLMREGGLNRELQFPGNTGMPGLVAQQDTLFIVGSSTTGAYYSPQSKGFSNVMEQLRQDEDGIAPNEWPRVFIFINPARTGNSQDQLAFPPEAGNPAKDVVDAVTAICSWIEDNDPVAWADEEEGVCVLCESYDQGAEDNRLSNGGLGPRNPPDGNTDPEWHEKTHAELVAGYGQRAADLNTYLKPLTRQTANIKLLLHPDVSAKYRNPINYGGLSNAGNIWVADAMHKAAVDFADVYLADSQNAYGMVGVHAQNWAYYVKMGQLARFVKRLWLDGVGEPIRVPTQVKVDSANPTIGMALCPWVPADHVLAVDTGRIAKQKKLGVAIAADNLWPTTSVIILAADPIPYGVGAQSAIRFVSPVPMTNGMCLDIGVADLGHNFKVVPIAGPDLIESKFGYEFGPWLQPGRVPITVAAEALPALAPSPVPPAPPGPPAPPALAFFFPQVIAPDQVIYLSNADYIDGFNLREDAGVQYAQWVQDVVGGGYRRQATASMQCAYLPDSWWDGTACLRADGLTQHYRTSQVPNEFPGALKVGGAAREYWFIGKNEAVVADADTTRPMGGHGGSVNAYSVLTMRIISGKHVIEYGVTTSTGGYARVTTPDVSGYFYARGIVTADGKLQVEVNGQLSAQQAATIATALTSKVLFGTPSSGAGAYKGLWKMDFDVDGNLTGDVLTAMRAEVIAMLPPGTVP